MAKKVEDVSIVEEMKDDKKKAGKSGYIRRKVKTSTVANVYKVKGGKMELVAENRNFTGNVSIPSLKKEYDAEDIHVSVVKTIYTYYGITVDKFMEQAEVVGTEEV